MTGKDDQVVLADQRAKELQVQLADRESVIRCLEMESADLKLDIDKLSLQINGMVPRQDFEDLQKENKRQALKIEAQEAEISELHKIVDKANQNKAN